MYLSTKQNAKMVEIVQLSMATLGYLILIQRFDWLLHPFD